MRSPALLSFIFPDIPSSNDSAVSTIISLNDLVKFSLLLLKVVLFLSRLRAAIHAFAIVKVSSFFSIPINLLFRLIVSF